MLLYKLPGRVLLRPHALDTCASRVSRVSCRRCGGIHEPAAQCGQTTCLLLGWPQAGHLQMAVTSCRALPASNRERFFECVVFFLGTALRIDSQMSPSNAGMPKRMAGRAAARPDHRGRASCLDSRDHGLDVWKKVDAESRGMMVEDRRRGSVAPMAVAIVAVVWAVSQPKECARNCIKVF